MNTFEQGLRRYFTEEQLEKISHITVGIAGAGGLGSNCAMLLARSGFKNFIIVDMDCIEASNLNRQNFVLAQVGEQKAIALSDNIKLVNPDAKIETHVVRLTEDTLTDVFYTADVLVEAFDDPDMKRYFAECFADGGRLAVSASGIAGCGNSDRLRTKKMGQLFYLVGDGQSGIDRMPPLAPAVAIAAAKQADIVLAHTLGERITH